MTADALDDLVAELRDEAVKDGDPETCLGWAAADAIDGLRAKLVASETRRGTARPGLARSGWVWQAWCGRSRRGRAWPGVSRRGVAGVAWLGTASRGWVWQAWHGPPGLVVAWRGRVWCGGSGLLVKGQGDGSNDDERGRQAAAH